MESKFDEKLFAGKEPLTIFRRWFEEAKKTEINDPDAIALATVDEEGMPNVRMVLLRIIEDDGFVFFTKLCCFIKQTICFVFSIKHNFVFFVFFYYETKQMLLVKVQCVL